MIFKIVQITAAVLSLISVIAGVLLAHASPFTLLWLIIPITAYTVATRRTWDKWAGLIHLYLFAIGGLAMWGAGHGHNDWLMLTAVLSSMVAWYIADLIRRGGTADSLPKTPHLVALGGIVLCTFLAHAIVNARLIPISSRWLMSLGAVLIISLIQISRMLTKID